MAEALQEPFCFEALHSGSISFGRFETEPLSWERRSAFSYNNYLEEVEKYSKPGSVNQRKAYFEVFFKKKGLLRPPDSLSQNWTERQATEGEDVDDLNYMEQLYRECFPEHDGEISNNHGEHEAKGEVQHIAKDPTRQQKQDLSRSRTVKQPVQNISTAKTSLSKTPKSMEVREVEKQKQHASAKVKETGKAGSVLQTSNKRKDGSITGQSASRPHSVARSSTDKTTKPSASTINSNQNVKKAANKNAVPVQAETTKLGRKSSDPVSKVTGVDITSTSSTIRPLGTQPSKTSGTPSKGKEKFLPTTSPAGGKQAGSKTHDASASQTVSRSSKLSKLQSQSSSPSPVRRDLSGSSASSSFKLLGSQRTNRTESPTKNILPKKLLPGGKEVENRKRDLSPSKTVCKPSNLAKLQPKSLNLSPVRRAPSESSTSSSIKQLSSQLINRTESPMKNNLPTKSLTGGKEVAAKKGNSDTSKAVTKQSKLEKLQSKTSSPSPVRRSPSESSSSSLKQLSSQRTNRTESPLKNCLPTKCLPGGKEVAAKKRDSDSSQTVSKRSKLETLQPKLSSPSPVRRAPTASSKSSSIGKLSSQTNRSQPPVKNNMGTKSLPGGKEASAKKQDLKLQRESSSSSSVLKAAAASSTSSHVGDFSPQPNKGIEVPRKSNEKKFPASPSPVHKSASASLSSTGQHAPQTMKRSEIPNKNRNETKQVGTKGQKVNPPKRESVPSNSTKAQGKPSASASRPVGSTTRTNNIESLGRRVESVKAVKRSESPRRDTGTPKRVVSVRDPMDKVGKRSPKLEALR